MMKTATKRRKVVMPGSIRKKLSAALCMLLVSSIMLVSTTYAWFTLSTAPEVTGITTNVGANGNLEIALLNTTSYASYAEDLGIVSNVGDSMTVKPATEANETWGNLVDLSSSTYGLSNVVLTPAALNITEDGKTVNPAILKAPSYGSDGRVIDVNTNTFTGGYVGGNFVYKDTDTTTFAGVRAIGTTTQVSQRVASYRNAKAAITTNMNGAKSDAASSLTSNGQHLANIMVGHVQDNTTKVTAEQMTALKNMVARLQSANTKAGNAIKQAVLAYSLSSEFDTTVLTDEQVSTLVTEVDALPLVKNVGEETEAPLTVADLEAIENVKIPNEAADRIAKWSTIYNSLKSAKSTLDGLGEHTDYEYTSIEPALNALVNKQHTEIAGITNPTSANLQAIIDYYMLYQKIGITMLSGSGVYADLAELVGNYTASGLKVHVEYNGIVANAPVTMNTDVTPDALIGTITTGSTPSSGNVSNAILSDTYGYAIDFGFRTNAAGSNLQLQTAGIQRVYNGTDASNSAVTQGSGSYMEFHSADTTTFTVDEVRALMSAIRVAFVTPVGTGGYQVLGLGALDITRTEENGKVTYTGGKTVKADGTIVDSGASGANGLKADLYLYNYTVATVSPNEYAINLGAKKDDQTALTALEQNVAKKVTVIVYLDGDLVDNTMVANAMTSMNGKMNLQFSSSATLTPMENSALRNATKTPVTYTEKAVAGAEYPYGGMTGQVKPGYTIYSGSDGKFYYKQESAEKYIELTVNNYSTVVTLQTQPKT